MSCSPYAVVITQGDRFPFLSIPLSTGCCEDFDPDDYVGWTLSLIGPATITGAMTYDVANGVVVYVWQVGSTDVPGLYLATVKATHVATGQIRTFPGVTEVFIAAVLS